MGPRRDSGLQLVEPKKGAKTGLTQRNGLPPSLVPTGCLVDLGAVWEGRPGSPDRGSCGGAPPLRDHGRLCPVALGAGLPGAPCGWSLCLWGTWPASL